MGDVANPALNLIKSVKVGPVDVGVVSDASIITTNVHGPKVLEAMNALDTST